MSHHLLGTLRALAWGACLCSPSSCPLMDIVTQLTFQARVPKLLVCSRINLNRCVWGEPGVYSKKDYLTFNIWMFLASRRNPSGTKMWRMTPSMSFTLTMGEFLSSHSREELVTVSLALQETLLSCTRQYSSLFCRQFHLWSWGTGPIGALSTCKTFTLHYLKLKTTWIFLSFFNSWYKLWLFLVHFSRLLVSLWSLSLKPHLFPCGSHELCGRNVTPVALTMWNIYTK